VRPHLHAPSQSLLRDPEFIGVLSATIEEGGGGDVALGGRKRARRPPATGGCSSAVPCLPVPWPSVLGYLRGFLSPAALMENQYAGPLEIAAVARLLGRRAIVLVEADNRGDFGGLYNAEATAGCSALPVAFVTTRRRHTFPLVLTATRAVGATGVVAGSSPVPADSLEALTVRVGSDVDALCSAVRTALGAMKGGTGSVDNEDLPAAALTALERLVQG
jgi:hypothetical protein